MHRLRSSFSHFALLVGLTCWLAGLSAENVHGLVTVHVVCHEHGEVVGLDSTAATAHSRLEHSSNDQIRAAGEGSHPEHGCVLRDVVLAGVPPGVASVEPPVLLASPVAQLAGARPDAPRAPPLTYAPKTSPPDAVS